MPRSKFPKARPWGSLGATDRQKHAAETHCGRLPADRRQGRVKGSIAPLIELGAGFHHELTGRENILLNGLLMGYSKRDMREREQSIIDFADIGDFIDSPVKQYSSGMYAAWPSRWPPRSIPDSGG